MTIARIDVVHGEFTHEIEWDPAKGEFSYCEGFVGGVDEVVGSIEGDGELSDDEKDDLRKVLEIMQG